MKEAGEDQEPHGQTTSRSGWEILEGMVEGERDRGNPRVTWTDNIKEWIGNIGGNGGGRKRQGKTKSHMDRQHQGVDGKNLEGMVEGERDRGRPRVTLTDNIKEWMGNIGGNGGG